MLQRRRRPRDQFDAIGPQYRCARQRHFSAQWFGHRRLDAEFLPQFTFERTFLGLARFDLAAG